MAGRPRKTALEKRDTAERREFLRKRAELEATQDLRDDVMSLVRNSGVSFEEIHNRCGPTPGTLERWSRKETDKPQLGKMRSTLRVIGYDIGIIEARTAGFIRLIKGSAA